MLTAESAHRSYILDDRPDMVGKVLTLGQAAAAIERVGTGLGREELLLRLARSRGNAGLATDIGDPYRRGPEAAAECADHISRLLGVVIPALR
ncbi:hypothetical protein [Nocardioides sp.]|uniref:hypothetical protein n=1 Tax=Nocardioides sp. TaxID=35761 RepID=UPI0039E5FF44